MFHAQGMCVITSFSGAVVRGFRVHLENVLKIIVAFGMLCTGLVSYLEFVRAQYVPIVRLYNQPVFLRLSINRCTTLRQQVDTASKCTEHA